MEKQLTKKGMCNELPWLLYVCFYLKLLLLKLLKEAQFLLTYNL